RAGDAIMAAVSTKPTPAVPANTPATAPQNAPKKPQPTPTGAKKTALTATAQPTPWRATLTSPPQTKAQQTTKQNPQTPSLRYANGTVGPTPWPTPKQTQSVQTKPLGPKPTPDFRNTRPRVVPTPTPAPKKLAAAKAPANQLAKAKPAPTPKPAVKKEQPTPTPTPRPEPAVKKQFNIEVCAVSHLIPVKGLCTTRMRMSFNLGEEPTRICSSEKHR
ncbi:MAG: hypothetical protein ACRD82_15900, partial [Blastocatellia bacterium]